MKAKTGPTYQEAAERLYGLAHEQHLQLDIRLVAPIKRLDGRGWSSWVAVLHVSVRGDPQMTDWAAQETFGRGGAWASLPEALSCLALRLELDTLAGAWPKPKVPAP